MMQRNREKAEEHTPDLPSHHHDSPPNDHGQSNENNENQGLVGHFDRDIQNLLANFNSPKESSGGGEYVHVENTMTGRFRRYPLSKNNSDNDNDTPTGRESPLLDNNRNILSFQPNSSRYSSTIDHASWAASRQHTLKMIFQVAYVSFLFLQGILAGLSIQSMYESFIVGSANEFMLQYNVHRANETRRCYFLGISCCVSGSLCLIGESAILSIMPSFVKISMKRMMTVSGSTTNNSGESQSGGSGTESNFNLCTSLVYFIALGVSQIHSIVDYRIMMMMISNLNINGGIGAEDQNNNYYEDGDKDIGSIFYSWRGLAVARSILCIVGWLVSCYELYWGYRKYGHDHTHELEKKRAGDISNSEPA